MSFTGKQMEHEIIQLSEVDSERKLLYFLISLYVESRSKKKERKKALGKKEFNTKAEEQTRDIKGGEI